MAGAVGDRLLLLEHDPVLTLGRGASMADVLADEQERARLGLAMHETGRGGGVTYHGPGQLVGYPIFDLKPDRCDVRRYVRDLAAVMIGLAGDYGVAAGIVPTDSRWVGVWVDVESASAWDEARAIAATSSTSEGGGARLAKLAKLGAIGVRLSRWVTMHGFAFNVCPDLGAYRSIVPCGIREFGVTSLSALGADASVAEVAGRVAAHVGRVFGASVTSASESAVAQLLASVDIPA